MRAAAVVVEGEPLTVGCNEPRAGVANVLAVYAGIDLGQRRIHVVIVDDALSLAEGLVMVAST